MKKRKCIFSPDQYYQSMAQMDFVALYQSGIRILLTDMDNTLIPHGTSECDEFAKTQITRIQEAGIECVILSNAKSARLVQFINQTALPYVPKPMKPFQKGIRLAYKMYPNLDKQHFALIGDQIFTDTITGRIAGILTILVDPLNPDEPLYIRFKRILEKTVKKKHFY